MVLIGPPEEPGTVRPVDEAAQNRLPQGVTLRNQLRPGDIGSIVTLHGLLYSLECGWDHTFEAYVAGPLAEFAKAPGLRERIWIAERNGTIAGSLAIVEASEGEAQLRWFLIHPDLRGRGMGRMMIEDALRFCRDCGYRSVFLWTERSLAAAAALYRSVGFRLTEEKTHPLWGSVVTEQRYESAILQPVRRQAGIKRRRR